MTAADLRVLIVEDEPITARTYEGYLERVPGFRAAATAHTLDQARRVLHAALRGDGRVDVVLLDLNLPDGHALDLLAQVRGAGFTGAVLALTAATELPVVRRALALGVTQYLVKPFGFDEFAQRLEATGRLVEALTGSGRAAGQADVDRAFRAPAASGPRTDLPKGLGAETLEAVRRLLRDDPTPRSAAEVGQAVGTSRVTARRYLEHLVETGRVERATRKGGRGRPEHEYRRRED